MNILVQPSNTEEEFLVEEWLKEKQISFKKEEDSFTEAQLSSIERGLQQADKGLLKRYTQVTEKAREIVCGN